MMSLYCWWIKLHSLYEFNSTFKKQISSFHICFLIHNNSFIWLLLLQESESTTTSWHKMLHVQVDHTSTCNHIITPHNKIEEKMKQQNKWLNKN